jgi:hypothetical protein
MPNSRSPYRDHIQQSSELITTSEQTRQGFIRWALEKNTLMAPYVDKARALQAAGLRASTPAELLLLPDIQSALATAAGISDKATARLSSDDKLQAIRNMIHDHLEPAGPAFVEELVYRFLLVSGGSLFGQTNNVVGKYAQLILTRALVANLALLDQPYQVQYVGTARWVAPPSSSTGIERFVKGLAWASSSHPRVVLMNVKVPVVQSNVDIVLLNCTPERALERGILANTAMFVALGELKGGDDPAGADEHWKTARSALQRIWTAFAAVELRPKSLFIGSSISPRMSDEIWGYLERHVLDNAANLNHSVQLNSICRWLCSI